MFDGCKNSKKQGDRGVGAAISFFMQRGQTVLFPLSDSEPYDLAFDDGDKLNKVQVKTTGFKSPCGIYVVSLRTKGGNQSFHTTKFFDASKVDFLFVMAEDGSKYLIPSIDIKTTTSVNLGKQMQKYKFGS